MPYQPYFSLNLFHNYYQQKSCADFVVEPTRATQRILKGHRLLLKPSENGLQILVPLQTEQQQPVIPLANSLKFTFLLRLTNTDFINFTQLAPNYRPHSSLYVFSNNPPSDADPLTLTSSLLDLEFLSKPTAEQSPLEARCSAIAELHTVQRSKIFGVVEIYHNDFLASDFNQNHQFKITFEPRKLDYWAYYLVANQATTAESFSIKDDQGDITFSPPLVNPEDRISAEIQNRFPQSQTILIKSDVPVVCREIGRPHLQLLKKNGNQNGSSELWIPHLPNPPNRHGTQVINLIEEL